MVQKFNASPSCDPQVNLEPNQKHKNENCMLTKKISTLTYLCLLAFTALAQTPTTSTSTPTSTPVSPASPSNFAAAGVGFQKTSSPQTSGWATVCHSNPTVNLWGLSLPSYLCASTDYSGVSTSARADIATVIVQHGWFTAGTKTGVGVSTASNTVGSTNVGGAFDLGGWASFDTSKLFKVTGLKTVVSISWLKQDISGISGEPPATILRDLSERAVFRFGFGRSW